jgi:hypothetical protein
MRLLLTGSRDWPDPDAIWAALDEVLATVPDGETLTVVHGACPTGADLEADRWARARRAETGRDVVREPHPAHWKLLGHRAGPIRNEEMVRLGADLCLAFIHRDSRGASHCARTAEDYGIPTTIHRSGS